MPQSPCSVSRAPVADGELDDAALVRLRRFGGETLLRELVQLFVEHAPARVTAAREGLVAGDATEAKRSLHALKSSSAQLGATRLQRLCQTGESDAAAGRLDALPALMDAIEAELALVARRLREAAGLS